MQTLVHTCLSLSPQLNNMHVAGRDTETVVSVNESHVNTYVLVACMPTWLFIKLMRRMRAPLKACQFAGGAWLLAILWRNW